MTVTARDVPTIHIDATALLADRTWLDTASRRPLTRPQLEAAIRRLAKAWGATVWEPR